MNLHRLLFRLSLGRRFPTTSGTLEVPGVRRAVVVRRDGYGIPYIEAEVDEDAWYGLGFCQGQDRAFKLETLLRVARGTLAELVGRRGVNVDRLSRRIGFLHAARLQIEVLDPEIRGMLEAFARGVTEGSSLGCRRPAHEFTLLRAKPTPFSAVDIVAVSKLLSLSLASNWDIEIARHHILNEDGPEALAALDPAYPQWLPVTDPPGAPAGPAIDRLAEDLMALLATAGLGQGSNGWVISPARTVTGRAILANDPHLPPMLPPHWYLAHIRTPNWAVSGATMAGVPVFPAGHNDVAAWGLTAGLADNTDLFIEELGPDGRTVRDGDRFVPCQVRTEIIRVKGLPEVVEEVVVTPRGPVIGPSVGGDTCAMSMQATWLAPRPIRGLLRVHMARSFDEFRRAFEEWPLMSLNMLYADTRGKIGWQFVGEVPRRRKGWGTVPLPGWAPDAGWYDEPVAFDQMPFVEDPPQGALATANNQPVPEGDGPFLGVDWIDGYRQARISEEVLSHDSWDVAGAQALQRDEVSVPWRKIRGLVLGASAQSDDARKALELLGGWDGLVAVESPGAAVFELFVSEMSRRIAQAKAPRSWAWAVGKGSYPGVPRTLFAARRVGHLVRLMRDRPEGWFDRPWADEVDDALATVIKTLRAKYGDGSGRWAWGHIRTLTLRHASGERPLLGRVFNRGPFPWGGDVNTVSVSAPDPVDPIVNPLSIASLRMVVDVGNWDEGRFSLPGGQSGNPLSPHYDDLLPLWRTGEGVPIAWSPEALRRTTRATLRLAPAAGVSAAEPRPRGDQSGPYV